MSKSAESDSDAERLASAVSLPYQSRTVVKWADFSTFEVVNRFFLILGKLPAGVVTKNLCYFAFLKLIYN